MEKDRYYIAYGSNLNVAQMEVRCPTAKVYSVGVVHDYRLVFKALGAYAYCTIEESVGDYVPVVVWKIRREDERNLDRYEGFPTHYYKKKMRVNTKNNTLDAMVYVMNDKAMYKIPSEKYFDVVQEGYRSFGLDEAILYEALAVSKNYGIAEDKTLRFFRNINGMTQEELSAQAGVSVRSIQNYESGVRGIDCAKAKTVQKLAEALNVSIEKLIS